MDNLKIVSHSWKRIITKEDLIELHWIDETKYELISFLANVWEQGQASKDGSNKIVQLHQVKASFKPIHQLVVYEDMLRELFSKDVPTIPNRHKHNDTGVLANFTDSDIHFDRLEHNPKKYLKTLDETRMRLIDDVMKFEPERILYANIGDYFNTDGSYTTTKGTPQVNSMKEQDAFKMGLEHQMKLIETLSSILPTDVIYVPGNHDEDKLQYLSDAMKLFYGRNDNVTIDNWTDPRKYYAWGQNTLWFAHGDKLKEKDILSLMSLEDKIRKHNYFYKGHVHHQLKQTYGNLIVETLSSPAITNDYERKHGYMWTGKMSAKLFDKKNGKIGEFERVV